MLKFIKMKYHDAYLLYYSVLFVVIVVFTVIENFSANWSQRWKKIENSSGMHFFMFEIFWSGPVKTKTRKSCSRFEIKWQSTWFRHGFLNLLIWFSLERLHSLKKNWMKQKRKKKNRNEVLFLSQTVSLLTSLS